LAFFLFKCGPEPRLRQTVLLSIVISSYRRVLTDRVTDQFLMAHFCGAIVALISCYNCCILLLHSARPG